ncbi:MAG: hypothetical protein KF888_02270 [Nitrosomonas sp.]|nr:hypothetical protein [Nitrosomonas sp.]
MNTLNPENRLVLLGASNLTLSLRLIIQFMQQYCGAPSEVLVAAGHGRSYGLSSQVLMRQLPGIVQSGLWRQLHSAEAGVTPVTYAFLTDIGNDIPYEAAPAEILNWVSWCVAQLQRHCARIVMTNIPIASIESLPERRFNLLRNVLFPSCRLSRIEVIERARVVHQGLIDLAERRQLTVCEVEPGWMSFDGIHIAYWKRCAFYRQILKSFEQAGQDDDQSEGQVHCYTATKRTGSLSPWQRRPRFAVCRVFGTVKREPQPSGFFKDQTAVSLY